MCIRDRFLGGGKQGVKFARMMGIVVVYLGAVVIALVFESAAGAGEGGQAGGNGVAADAQGFGCRCGGQGIENVVVARYPQGHMAINCAVLHNIKRGTARCV